MTLHSVTRTLQVPKATGVQGFLRTIERVLTVPRLRSMHVSHTGQVSYEALVPEEVKDLPVLDVELESLLPSQLLRNIETAEYLPKEGSTPTDQVVGTILQVLAAGLFPCRWLCADLRTVHKWSGLVPSVADEDLLGFPVMEDPGLPREALILLGAVLRGAALVDSSLAVVLSMGVGNGQ